MTCLGQPEHRALRDLPAHACFDSSPPSQNSIMWGTSTTLSPCLPQFQLACQDTTCMGTLGTLACSPPWSQPSSQGAPFMECPRTHPSLHSSSHPNRSASTLSNLGNLACTHFSFSYLPEDSLHAETQDHPSPCLFQLHSSHQGSPAQNTSNPEPLVRQSSSQPVPPGTYNPHREQTYKRSLF